MLIPLFEHVQKLLRRIFYLMRHRNLRFNVLRAFFLSQQHVTIHLIYSHTKFNTHLSVRTCQLLYTVTTTLISTSLLEMCQL